MQLIFNVERPTGALAARACLENSSLNGGAIRGIGGYGGWVSAAAAAGSGRYSRISLLRILTKQAGEMFTQNKRLV